MPKDKHVSRSIAAASTMACIALLGAVWVASSPASRADSNDALPEGSDIGKIDPQVLAARNARLSQVWEDYENKTASVNPPLILPKTGTVIPVPDGFRKEANGHLVSLHFVGTPNDAFAEMTKLTDVPFVTTPEPLLRHGHWPAVTLDATERPLMEMVLETCSQSGLQIAPNESQAAAAATQPALLLSRNAKDHVVGDWCVCGAFAFMITQMTSTINMASDLHADGRLQISMNAYCEPGVRVCVAPRRLDLDTVVDEKGNSLAAPDGGGVNFGPNLGQVVSSLIVPGNAGNTIVKFRAHYHAVIATKVENVVLDPFSPGAAASKTIGGMNIAFGLQGDSQYTLSLSASRGIRDDVDWNNLAMALKALKPELLDASGTALNSFPNNQQSGPDGDSVSVTTTFYSRSATGSAVGVPAKLVVDVPIEVHAVDIPVEFDNLPLP